MKNTHPMFRAVSLAIGLALLVVTGTAAMMAVFSGPASSNPHRAYGQPVLLAPVPEAAQALSTMGEDQVLYQRVVRADGTQAWQLTPAAPMAGAKENRSNAAIAMRPSADVPAFSRVSYNLQARPAGFSKPLKSCHVATNQGARSRTLAAYDISCTYAG